MQRLEAKLSAIHIGGMKLCSSAPPERRTVSKVRALLTRHRCHHWVKSSEIVLLCALLLRGMAECVLERSLFLGILRAWIFFFSWRPHPSSDITLREFPATLTEIRDKEQVLSCCELAGFCWSLKTWRTWAGIWRHTEAGEVIHASSFPAEESASSCGCSLNTDKSMWMPIPSLPIYSQEDTSEVFQDFLIPRTEYTELSPFQPAWAEGRKPEIKYG